MKTKDFIAMLQKEDPTGEGYIRFPGGGAPYFAEAKEGYWDGAYQYLEDIDPEKKGYDNKRLVISTQGYKIDIHCMEVTDIVWDEDGNMEEIKKRIRYDNGNPRREAEGWASIEKEATRAREYHVESLANFTKEVIEKYYDGDVEIRQAITSRIGTYHNMTVHDVFTDKKVGQLNQGQCGALIQSGKFYPEKKEEYYVWRYDLEKGQDWSIK